MSRLPQINLRLRLKQAGITGKTLAQEVGVSQSCVSTWCKNGQVPYYQRAKVAMALSKYRTPAKPRTKLRKSAVNMSNRRDTYAQGFDSALRLVSTLTDVPTDTDTKLRLIRSLTSTSESR